MHLTGNPTINNQGEGGERKKLLHGAEALLQTNKLVLDGRRRIGAEWLLARKTRAASKDVGGPLKEIVPAKPICWKCRWPMG